MIRRYMTRRSAPKGRNDTKIFCIGCNKTGTTSVKAAFHELDYKVGDEAAAKYLTNDWAVRNFQPIIDYCHTAEAFQDSPFSFPYTYQALDTAFPSSKFILTIRDSADQWYDSITRFHAKLWGGGEIPSKEQLQQAVNVYKGRPWEVNRLLFSSPPEQPYKKENLIDFYEGHNRCVQEYFRHRPDDLLVLNVANTGAYSDFCQFLGHPQTEKPFPWSNKT
jgi:hypothetical protein